MSRLAELNKEYEDILHSDMDDNRKDLKLSDLMSRMEGEFRIPPIRDREWERRNPSIIALYRQISMSRSL